jgi:DNA polymerase-3 subunit delta'
MFLEARSPELVLNTDILPELRKLAQTADFEWLAAASDRLAEVERGLRRNLLRSLSLDAFEAALERA